ncbi:MAG: hypothetical protein J2P14_07405 [Acidothermales bacterium]|nr:hypothetical protein [Acidothermales bacterium]
MTEGGPEEQSGTAGRAAPQISADVADELRRMGLDPTALGLPPAPPSGTPDAQPPAASQQQPPPGPAQRPQPGPQQAGPGVNPQKFPEQQAGAAGQPSPGTWATQNAHRPEGVASVAGYVPQGVRRGGRTGLRGLANIGSAGRSMAQSALIERASARLRGPRRVAFLSFKGGVGKTTVTALTGLALSTLRQGGVAALDADPDRGTLVRRLDTVQPPSIRDFLWRVYQSPRSDPRLLAHVTPSGLHVLDSARSPILVDAPTPKELWWAVRTLERTCPVILLDCGTALTHPVTSAILKSVDAVTVVTTPSDDAVAACFSTLGWLERNGYERLAKDAAVAITDVRRSRFDRQAHSHVRGELTERVRTVLEFGYDAGLVRGGVIELDRLSVATREAALEAAAWVVSGHAR